MTRGPGLARATQGTTGLCSLAQGGEESALGRERRGVPGSGAQRGNGEAGPRVQTGIGAGAKLRPGSCLTAKVQWRTTRPPPVTACGQERSLVEEGSSQFASLFVAALWDAPSGCQACQDCFLPRRGASASQASGEAPSRSRRVEAAEGSARVLSRLGHRRLPEEAVNGRRGVASMRDPCVCLLFCLGGALGPQGQEHIRDKTTNKHKGPSSRPRRSGH